MLVVNPNVPISVLTSITRNQPILCVNQNSKRKAQPLSDPLLLIRTMRLGFSLLAFSLFHWRQPKLAAWLKNAIVVISSRWRGTSRVAPVNCLTALHRPFDEVLKSFVYAVNTTAAWLKWHEQDP